MAKQRAQRAVCERVVPVALTKPNQQGQQAMVTFKLGVLCGDMNRRELIETLTSVINTITAEPGEHEILNDAGETIGLWAVQSWDEDDAKAADELLPGLGRLVREGKLVGARPHITSMTIERDEYAYVWALSDKGARMFFGAADDAEVIVAKVEPQTEEEMRKFSPRAKLFGVKVRPSTNAKPDRGHATVGARRVP